MAAKTLVTAVDAATAEDPSAKRAGANTGHARRTAEAASPAAQSAGQPAGAKPPSAADRSAVRTRPDAVVSKAAKNVARTVTQARGVNKGLRHGSRRFGEAVWGPFVRLSGVLWLEVSGVFFGVFALIALGYLWKLRGAWHAGTTNAAEHRSALGAVAMLVLFGYFCVSSFMRARRRERRR